MLVIQIQKHPIGSVLQKREVGGVAQIIADVVPVKEHGAILSAYNLSLRRLFRDCSPRTELVDYQGLVPDVGIDLSA